MALPKKVDTVTPKPAFYTETGRPMYLCVLLGGPRHGTEWYNSINDEDMTPHWRRLQYEDGTYSLDPQYPRDSLGRFVYYYEGPSGRFFAWCARWYARIKVKP
jgi:hypothetical protein